MSNHPYNYGYGQYNNNNYYSYENNNNFHQRGGYQSVNYNRRNGNRGRGGWCQPYNQFQKKHNKHENRFVDNRSRSDVQTSRRGSSHSFSSSDKQKSLESEPTAMSNIDSSIENEKERLKKVEEDKARLSKLLSSSSKLLPVDIDNDSSPLEEENDQVSEKRESCLRLPTLELTESDYKQIGAVTGCTPEDYEEDEAETEEGNERNLVCDPTEGKISEDDVNDCELIEKPIETIVLDEVHVCDSGKPDYLETQPQVPLNDVGRDNTGEKLSADSSETSVVETAEIDNPMEESFVQHEETNDNVEKELSNLETTDCQKDPPEENLEDVATENANSTADDSNAKLFLELTEGDDASHMPLETNAENPCDEDSSLSENLLDKDQISLREETAVCNTVQSTVPQDRSEITNTSKTNDVVPVTTRTLNIIQEREEIIGFIDRSKDVSCDSNVNLSRRGNSFSKSKIFNLYRSFLKCRRYGRSPNWKEKIKRNMGNNFQENPFLNRENLVNVVKPLFNEKTLSSEEISDSVKSSDFDQSSTNMECENNEISENGTIDIAEQEADEFMDNYGHLLDDNFTIPVEVLHQLGLSDICDELNLNEIVSENEETPTENVHCDEPQSNCDKNFKENNCEVVNNIPITENLDTDISSTENDLTRNDFSKVVSSEKFSSEFATCKLTDTRLQDDSLLLDSSEQIQKDADYSVIKKEVYQVHDETASFVKNLSADEMIVDPVYNAENANQNNNSNIGSSENYDLFRETLYERMSVYLSGKKAPGTLKKAEKCLYDSTVKNMIASDYFQCAIDSSLKLKQSKSDINPASFILNAVGDTIMKNCNISNELKSDFASSMAHLMNYNMRKDSKNKMKKQARENFDSNLQFISDHFQISHPEVPSSSNLQDSNSLKATSNVIFNESFIEKGAPNKKQCLSHRESKKELRSLVMPLEEVNENTDLQVSGIHNLIGLLMKIDKNISFLTDLKLNIYKEIQRNNNIVNFNNIEQQNQVLNHYCQLLRDKLKSLDVEDRSVMDLSSSDIDQCGQSVRKISKNLKHLNKPKMSSRVCKRKVTQKLSSVRMNDNPSSDFPSMQNNSQGEDYIQCERDNDDARNVPEQSDIAVQKQSNDHEQSDIAVDEQSGVAIDEEQSDVATDNAVYEISDDETEDQSDVAVQKKSEKVDVHEQSDVPVKPSTHSDERNLSSEKLIIESEIQLRGTKRRLSISINPSSDEKNKRKCKKQINCTEPSNIKEQESSSRGFPSLLSTSIKNCFVDLSGVVLPKNLIKTQNVKLEPIKEDGLSNSTVVSEDKVINEDIGSSSDCSRTTRGKAANLTSGKPLRRLSKECADKKEIPADGNLTDSVMSDDSASSVLSSSRTLRGNKTVSPVRRSTRCQLSEPIDSDSDSCSAIKEPEISSIWGSCMHVNIVKEHEGDLFLGCDDGRTLRMKSHGDLLDHVYSGHDGPVNSIEFYNGYLITGSSDSSIILHCLSGHKNVIAAVPVLEPVQSLFVRWQLLYIGSKNGKITKFSCHRKCIVDKQIVVGAVSDSVLAIHATKEGPRRILIVSAKNQPLTIRDSSSGLLLRSVNVNDIFYSLAFYGSSSSVYCGCRNNSVLVFDFTTGEKVNSLKLGKNVIKLIIKWDILFTVSYDGFLHVYNLMKEDLIVKFRVSGLIIDMELWNNKIIVSTNDGPVVFNFPPELKKYLKEKSRSILKI